MLLSPTKTIHKQPETDENSPGKYKDNNKEEEKPLQSSKTKEGCREKHTTSFTCIIPFPSSEQPGTRRDPLGEISRNKEKNRRTTGILPPQWTSEVFVTEDHHSLHQC